MLEWISMIQRAIEVGGFTPPTQFVQVATLTGEGLPSVRTLVFRGWHGLESDRPCVKFATDLRSAKIAGIRHSECYWGEACWYFQDAREQYRLTGDLSVIGGEQQSDSKLSQVRLDVWRSLSDSARIQYRYPMPGAAREEVHNGQSSPFSPEPPPADAPEDTFGLILLSPRIVDYYCNKTMERIIFRLNDNKDIPSAWSRSVVNP